MKKLCGAPGCGQLVERGSRYCERHRRQTTPRTIRRDALEAFVREIRSSASWKRLRKARLAHDGYRCTFETRRGRCRATGTKRNPLDVHHVDPLSVTTENAFEFERTRTLCRRHHRTVEARDRAQATYDPERGDREPEEEPQEARSLG